MITTLILEVVVVMLIITTFTSALVTVMVMIGSVIIGYGGMVMTNPFISAGVVVMVMILNRDQISSLLYYEVHAGSLYQHR
jgi:hypothetical protein